MSSDFFSSVSSPAAPVRAVEPAPATQAAPVAPAAPSAADGASFVARARATIRQLVLSGDASVRNVARSLNTSGRTLQRRLQQDGTSLQQPISAVRCELAMEMLRNPGQSSNEISDQLGFSAPSAFHRAFKRWTGMTPGQYRRAEWRTPGPV